MTEKTRTTVARWVYPAPPCSCPDCTDRTHGGTRGGEARKIWPAAEDAAARTENR